MTTKFIGGIVVFTLILIALIAIGNHYKEISKQETKLTTYSLEDKEVPKIEFDHKVHNFGKIKTSPPSIFSFPIKNSGPKLLQITDFKSSCDCTFAVVKIDGTISPRFSMHNNPFWLGEIAPGKKGEVEITFDPTLHPIVGSVSRQVYFRTNDPKNPEIILEIQAEVEK